MKRWDDIRLRQPSPLWAVLAALLLLTCMAQAVHAQEQSASLSRSQDVQPDVYRLGHGDRLSVQVYGEEELSKEYAIGSNGRLSFPLLGEVDVAGLTATEVGQRLADALRGNYLIDPKITVTVVRYRPVYVNGEVKNPGAKDFEPGLTVRQAISLAGGMTERASSRKIYLISANASDAAQKPQRVSLDVRLKPGDTITIEESFF